LKITLKHAAASKTVSLLLAKNEQLYLEQTLHIKENQCICKSLLGRCMTSVCIESSIDQVISSLQNQNWRKLFKNI